MNIHVSLFAFASSNIELQTMINYLQIIFYLFDAPGYVHSDRGRSFVLNEIVSFYVVYAFPPAQLLRTTQVERSVQKI